MAGISSKALNGAVQNRNKFNGGNEMQSGEFTDGVGLELFDAVNRSYDPQLGRFWQIDELADANWEWTPYNFSINNPIRFNDPLGLKEGPNDVKTLPEVLVTAKKKLSHNEMQTVYWQIRDNGNDFSRVKSEALRERLVRWDGIQRHMDRVHEMTREQDKVVLEVASWIIPAGQLTKLRYLKYAAQLFKMKRGIHFTAGAVDLTSQLIVNKGDITEINLVSTASSTLIGNPFLSSIPGSFASFSIGRRPEFKSVANPDVYKSIFINTLGNVLGERLGSGFRVGSTLPGGQFIGEALGATGASVIEEMSNIGNK